MLKTWSNIPAVIDESEEVPKADEAKNDTVSYLKRVHNIIYSISFIL